MKDKLNEREIILEDDGHYWLRFRHGFDKDMIFMGKYDKHKDKFQLIGNILEYESSHFDIISDIILGDSEFKKF